jgi:hypothetical protein
METTKVLLQQLQQRLVAEYLAELQKFPMNKNTRETLVDGFRDGCRSGIHHAVQMFEIQVKD